MTARQSPTGTAIRLDTGLLTTGVHELLISADTAVYVPLPIRSLAVAKTGQMPSPGSSAGSPQPGC